MKDITNGLHDAFNKRFPDQDGNEQLNDAFDCALTFILSLPEIGKDWTFIKDQLPEPGVEVWICYKSRFGNKTISVGSLFVFEENNPHNYFYIAYGKSDIPVRFVHCWMPYSQPSPPKKLKK